MKIRTAGLDDVEGIARVRVESWQHAYRGIVPADYLDNLTVEETVARWKSIIDSAVPTRFSLVAEDDAGQIIAYAAGGEERSGDPDYTGEIYALYVIPGHMRQGIGRLLVRSYAACLVERGRWSMLIWVLEQNTPARRFYEALGGCFLYDRDITINSTCLKEVAYGWPNLCEFLENSS
jgi:ribosomal protein S18 acetylase RimI-like enzyme